MSDFVGLSVTIRGVNENGLEVVWQVAGLDTQEFDANLSHVAERLKKLKPIAALKPISENTNQDAAPKMCPIHKSAMSKHRQGNQVWYSHKVDGAWCRGE